MAHQAPLDAEKQGTIGHHVDQVRDDAELAIIAQRLKAHEEGKTLAQIAWQYKTALFWSVTVSMNIVMESYATILLNGAYAQPAFLESFGEMTKKGKLEIPAKWQTSMSLASSIGITIGIWLNGLLVDRFGHKRIMLVSLVFLSGFVAIVFCAKNKTMILIGQLLCGLPWGTLNVIAPAYAVETAPMPLRHYGPTFVNLCWVIGHLIGAGVQTGLVDNHTQWGWRIPFALNASGHRWIWPIPLIITAIFCPESPWWLVRRGRMNDALNAVKRLSTPDVPHEDVVALIEHTVRLEKDLNFGSSYWTCFKGVDRRRTEIALMAWCSQALVGFIVQGYQTYFFKQAGMPAGDSFKLTLGTYAVAFVGTVISMPLQQRYNRYTLWMSGLCAMFPIMFIVGILGCVKQTKTVEWVEGSILLVWFFNYGWSVGPLAFVIASEVGSVQLRQKTISIARGAQYILTIVNTVAAPYVLNPDQANLKGKAAFIPAGFTLLLIVWTYFRLPETRNKSFDELDIMFAKRLPARKFRDYVVTLEDEMPAAANKGIED